MKEKPAGQVGLPTAEHTCGHQLANLLNAAGVVLRVLEGAPSWMDDEPKGGALDGGTKMAAEASLCGILNRIDLIVQDDSRWSMENRDTLEKRSLEMIAQNIKFLEEQTKAAASVNRPSFRFKPTLTRITGGWAAVLGELTNPDQAIIGAGGSPEEALEAFDLLFAGQTPEEMLVWAQKTTLIENYEQEQTLDSRGPKGSGTHETKPSSNDANSRRPRAKRPRRGHNDLGDAPGGQDPAGGPSGPGGAGGPS